MEKIQHFGDTSFTDNVFLMVTALNLTFAYHGVDIEVKIEHKEALTSFAQ